MPPAPRHPAELHRRFFRGSTAVSEGLLTRNELRSTAWQRLFQDVYVCTCMPVSHATRATAAARMLLPGSVVSGRSAAVLWGIDAAALRDDVELTVPPSWNVSSTRGVTVRRRTLSRDSVTVRGGVRRTTALATAVDLGRTLPLDDAVVLLDRLVVDGGVDLAELRAATEAARGPGCRRA